MAQYSLNAYDADVWITEFKGLGPKGDHIGDDLRFAAEAMNVETPNGVLQPVGMPIIMSGENETAITGTEASIFYYSYYLTQTNTRLFVVTGGELYYITENKRWVYPYHNDPYYANYWYAPTVVEGANSGESLSTVVTNAGNAWQFCPADYVHTSNNPLNPSETIVNTHPAILMVKTTGSTLYRINVGNNYNPYAIYFDSQFSVQTPAPFRCIERYKERFWACGKGNGVDDAIYYSKPYDYTDWSDSSSEIPEDGAGMILLPTWDGDSFSCIRQFGDSLIFFKKNSIFKLTGSDPSNFYISRQNGPGTQYPDTIVIDNSRIIFARDDGIYIYDGNESRQILKDITDGFVWQKYFFECIGACLYNNKYILIGKKMENAVTCTMLVYDMTDGTVLLRDAPQIFAIERYSPYIVMRDPENSAKVVVRELNFDSWGEDYWHEYNKEHNKLDNLSAINVATKWVSPWIDLGRKTMQKGGFEVYFTPEVKELPVTFLLSIETEKKKKTKSVTIRSTTLKGARTKRVHFGGAGRRFRLIIETLAGNTNPWRLIGGIHIVAETDHD